MKFISETKKKEYSEKLKNPKWQRVRLRIMERDNFTCVLCGSNDNTLNVHHLFYIPDTEPWEHPSECLITVCENCHSEEHETKAYLLLACKVTLSILRLSRFTFEDFTSAFYSDIPDLMEIQNYTEEEAIKRVLLILIQKS